MNYLYRIKNKIEHPHPNEIKELYRNIIPTFNKIIYKLSGPSTDNTIKTVKYFFLSIYNKVLMDSDLEILHDEIIKM